MEAAVEDGPVKLARVLLGQEVGLALAVQQAERLEAPSASQSACSRVYLRVSTDKDLAVSGIDLGTGKVAQLSPTTMLAPRFTNRVREGRPTDRDGWIGGPKEYFIERTRDRFGQGARQRRIK